MVFIYIFLLILGIAGLVWSGGLTVRALSRIARFLEWREFVVAFILMAAATSVPEFFVGISSAFHGVSELSFGTIIGSNMVKLSLALGLAVLIGGTLPIEKITVAKNSFFTAIYALFPLLLILDGDISRIDGVILILAFFFYIAWLFDQKEKFTRVYRHPHEKIPGVRRKFFALAKNLGYFAGGVTLLLGSSELTVRSATNLSNFFNLPIGLLGLLILGAGTAMPEISFLIIAARRGHGEMILGNLMGGVVMTSSFVIGFVALMSPIKIFDFSPYISARLFLLISVILFLFFLKTHDKISRREGLIFLTVYVAFVLFELLGLALNFKP